MNIILYLKNNFSINTKKFREVMSNYLKENVNFQIGVKIKKIKFKGEKYELLTKMD